MEIVGQLPPPRGGRFRRNKNLMIKKNTIKIPDSKIQAFIVGYNDDSGLRLMQVVIVNYFEKKVLASKIWDIEGNAKGKTIDTVSDECLAYAFNLSPPY